MPVKFGPGDEAAVLAPHMELIARRFEHEPQRRFGSEVEAREAWAWASVFSPWLPARPDGNYTRHVPAIARTMSAWRYSAISARDGSRSATANSTRHRPQRSRHTRQPDPGGGPVPRKSVRY